MDEDVDVFYTVFENKRCHYSFASNFVEMSTIAKCSHSTYKLIFVVVYPTHQIC